MAKKIFFWFAVILVALWFLTPVLFIFIAALTPAEDYYNPHRILPRHFTLDHLYKLFSFLRPGGELVLETLVIEGPENQLLLPESRYAKMRNVWFIPTAQALKSWLHRYGYTE